MSNDELFNEIISVNPLNEAEVETKILLSIFKLLEFTTYDRADKPTVEMYFGREKKSKIADFILYNGIDRSATNALIAVETKKTKESLVGAEKQVISYAAWAGTPYYMTCNGVRLLISKYNPQSTIIDKVLINIKNIKKEWEKVYAFANKAELILNKERIDYINTYFPKIEKLPPNQFFNEYLLKFRNRFSYSIEPAELLSSINGDNCTINIPVNIDYDNTEYNDIDLAYLILSESHFMLIEGDPGCGKTTLCYRLAHKIVSLVLDGKDEIIPILISLKEYVPSDIFSAFKMSCKQLGVSVFEKIYSKKLSEVKIVVLLDGLDEVNDIDAGIRNLIKLLHQGSAFSLVITTRPHVLESISFGNYELQECKIVKLKDVEIRKLALKYGISISNEINKRQLDLSSPLQLLMYIKVTSEGLINDNFTIFELYLSYIKILTRYYNKIDDSSYFDELLNIYSNVANEVIQHANNGNYIGVNELFDIFNDNKNNRYLSNLVKCGIITSRNGKANFLHKSFEEFGVAYGIANGIKTNDVAVLKKSSPSTANTYYIASAGLSSNQIDNMVELLNDSNNRVRKRVIGVLKYFDDYIDDRIEDKLIELLYKEKSPKVIHAIYNILSKSNNPAIIIQLLLFNRIKKQKKIEFLKNIENEVIIHQIYRILETKQEKYSDNNICYWLVTIIINWGMIYFHREDIVNLLQGETHINKAEVFTLITNKENRTLCNELILRLYTNLDDPGDILNLYHKDYLNNSNINQEIIDIIFSKLETYKYINFSDFKRLKDIYTDSSLDEKYIERIKNIALISNYNLELYKRK